MDNVFFSLLISAVLQKLFWAPLFLLSMFQNVISPNRQAIRLFCVPHAGSGASAYRGWKEQLRPEIEATIIELPGREARFRESPYSRLEHLVNDLADAIVPCLVDDQKFAFFGNSLGGLIAFEALHEIRRRTGKEAIHLFVSAAGAPHLESPVPPMGHLGDSELVAEVSERYGGIPAALLEDEEFLAAMLPTLRADIVMLEAYIRRVPHPLSCPITAFGGKHDLIVPMDHIEAWREQTSGSFDFHPLDEGHLYLQSARSQLTATIRDSLSVSCEQ